LTKFISSEICRVKKTLLSEVGEFGLIQRMLKGFASHHPTTLTGPGDDAAVIRMNSGRVQLVSTDLLLENIHFNLVYTPLRHLGYKSVVASVSDIAAMNAHAREILVSVGISNRFSVEDLEELYAGIQLACDRYQLDLIGGDTSSSASGLMISVTAMGYTHENAVVKRSGARKGDLLVVSGQLGGACAGLQILEREKFAFESSPGITPDLSGHEEVLQRQLRPEARVDMIEMLESLDIIPTSMIDVSDGLSSEALHIAHASGLGLSLYEEKIPVSAATQRVAEAFGTSPMNWALHGGEDYELLFTISPSNYEKIAGVDSCTVIGHMNSTGEKCFLKTTLGETIELHSGGWNGLANESAKRQQK
jgi:thiamine-monophosphate kinase